MADADFDLSALYAALDEQRRVRGLSWAAVTREVNARFEHVPWHKPIATSTITSLRNKEIAEGDGVLQMLLWLGRTPESFFAGAVASDPERARLPELGREQILRWDTKAMYSALDAQRQARAMSWAEVAHEIGGYNASGLTRLSRGGRTGFPRVMRIVRWLGQPATTFTRASDW